MSKHDTLHDGKKGQRIVETRNIDHEYDQILRIFIGRFSFINEILCMNKFTIWQSLMFFRLRNNFDFSLMKNVFWRRKASWTELKKIGTKLVKLTWNTLINHEKEYVSPILAIYIYEFIFRFVVHVFFAIVAEYFF